MTDSPEQNTDYNVLSMKRGKTKKCPQCGQPSVEKYRPFCSQRCVDLDLGAWFSESYRIPTPEEVENDELAKVHPLKGED